MAESNESNDFYLNDRSEDRMTPEEKKACALNNISDITDYGYRGFGLNIDENIKKYNLSEKEVKEAVKVGLRRKLSRLEREVEWIKKDLEK